MLNYMIQVAVLAFCGSQSTGEAARSCVQELSKEGDPILVQMGPAKLVASREVSTPADDKPAIASKGRIDVAVARTISYGR